MQKEARATEGLRTFREYAEISGTSYEAVRKKVETHSRRYEIARDRLRNAEASLNYLKGKADAAADPGAREQYQGELEKAEMICKEARAEYETVKAFYDGVKEIGSTKYLNEAAQAYLDRQKRETVVTVPDRDSKAALQVAKEESEALRRQILNLQEALLTERTGKLQDLQEADRSAAEDAKKRIQWLESRVKVLAEEVEDLQNEVEALQITKKAEYDRLTERIDNLYNEVLKNRKRGLFGRITGE